MTAVVAPNWVDKIYQFLSRKAVYHTLIWLVYMAGLLFMDSGEEGMLVMFRNTVIHIFFLMVIVYFNYWYLIPNYLFKKKYITYIILALLTAAVVMPIELVSLYWNISDNLEAQLQLLQKQTGHFVFLFLTLLLSTVLKIIKEWIQQQRIQKDLENKNLQSELSFLKSQINPHFLFNTLNSIYALTLKKSDKAPELVLRLSEMMRYMLYKSNEKQVPLEQEIKYIRNYLELEKMRYGNKAEITFSCQGDFLHSYKVAPLLFITFLENSFKHGLSKSIKHGFVNCQLKIEDGTIYFLLKNSKTKEHDERYFQGGIGLRNVRRRLELIYPNRYKLDVDDGEEVYTVNLQLEVAEQNELEK